VIGAADLFYQVPFQKMCSCRPSRRHSKEHGRFLPSPFQYITHTPTHHSTPWSLCRWLRHSTTLEM